MIAFISRANSFKRPKSLASLYLLCQQQLSTTHRTVYQFGSSLKRVISTLMAHKSETSTASFSGTSSSFQRGSGEHSSKGFGLGLAEHWPPALPAEMSEIDGAVIYKAPVSSVVSSFAPQLLQAQNFLSDGLHHSALFIVGVIGLKRGSLTELIFNFRRVLKFWKYFFSFFIHF